MCFFKGDDSFFSVLLFIESSSFVYHRSSVIVDEFGCFFLKIIFKKSFSIEAYRGIIENRNKQTNKNFYHPEIPTVNCLVHIFPHIFYICFYMYTFYQNESY